MFFLLVLIIKIESYQLVDSKMNKLEDDLNEFEKAYIEFPKPTPTPLEKKFHAFLIDNIDKNFK